MAETGQAAQKVTLTRLMLLCGSTRASPSPTPMHPSCTSSRIRRRGCPTSVLGRDAAGFAALGHSVMAVEPTAELRTCVIGLYASSRIEWLDDGLPELSLLSERGETFNVVMLTAVWMHLDEQQRRHAMPRVVALVRPGGMMMISLRHGPVPDGRRIFDVTAAETVRLAHAQEMACVQHLEAGDGLLNRRGVTWDRLAFRKDDHSG